MTQTDQLVLRRARDDDFDEIVEVCGRSLDWSDDQVDADFFRWKHIDNPFGRSPIWVAEDADGPGGAPAIVGVRAMMRWKLHGADGRTRSMTRAVDTATLPTHQGQGIFSRLTRLAVEELTAEGADGVFNTPNDKSRPGYLKMGWHDVGRVPVIVRPRTPLSLLAMARSKVAAEKWGQATDVGLDPDEALADVEAVDAALSAQPAPSRLATPMSFDYLRWRTAFAPLQCRIEPIGSRLADGFIVFRLRRRGSLVQLSVLHVVGPAESTPLRRAIGRLLGETGADVALAAGTSLGLAQLLVPLPGAGPRLTWRPLADSVVAELGELELPLGALELF